jgi:tight adherence protein C
MMPGGDKLLVWGLGIAAVVMVVGLFLEARVARRRRVQRRLLRYSAGIETEISARVGFGQMAQGFGAILNPVLQTVTAGFFAREADRVKMRKLLLGAGFAQEGALVVLGLAKFACTLLGAIAGYGAVALGWIGAGVLAMQIMVVLGGGVAGAIAPEFILGVLRDRRRGRLRDALPDAIDLMVIAAHAGQSLDMALTRVSREMRAFAPELAHELSVTTAELQALPERSTALRNLADRSDLREMRTFSLSVIQTLRTGSPFAESLKALGGDLRAARMIAAEERGAKLPALLTLPLIVFIMPAVFVVVVGPAIVSMSALFKM